MPELNNLSYKIKAPQSYQSNNKAKGFWKQKEDSLSSFLISPTTSSSPRNILSTPSMLSGSSSKLQPWANFPWTLWFLASIVELSGLLPILPKEILLRKLSLLLVMFKMLNIFPAMSNFLEIFLRSDKILIRYWMILKNQFCRNVSEQEIPKLSSKP